MPKKRVRITKQEKLDFIERHKTLIDSVGIDNIEVTEIARRELNYSKTTYWRDIGYALKKAQKQSQEVM